MRTKEAIGKKLGRRPSAVARMAERLGLGQGCPRGYEYVSEAAERCGYTRRQMVLILAFGGVRMRLPSSRRARTGHRAQRVVDPTDVDEAVALWCSTETISEAAQRNRVSRFVLERLVLADERTPPRNGRHRLRVPSWILDELAARVNAEHQRPWLVATSGKC